MNNFGSDEGNLYFVYLISQKSFKERYHCWKSSIKTGGSRQIYIKAHGDSEGNKGLNGYFIQCCNSFAANNWFIILLCEKTNFFVNLTEWNNNFVYVRGERGFKTYTWLNPCYFFQVISSFEETLTSTLTTVDVTGDLDSIATVDDICCKMNGLNFIFCTLIINSEYIEEWSVVRYLTFLFPWKKPENCCS